MDLKQSLWPGWETVRLIGRGSFGAVYEIQRDVFVETEKAALKVISIPQNESDIREMLVDGYDEESISSTFAAHLKGIVAEYSLMRKMNGSSNVVNCDDFRYVQHEDGIGWDIFIKMELLTPLADVLSAVIPEDMVIRIAMDMCEALALCDRHNIVHRDIKPQNIFVSQYGDYKLGDFGIAKTVEKTMGGTKTGTYKYMAPEVYNNQPYGSTADIYSLGLVLYWLLNERRMPFMPLPPAKLSAGMDEESRARRFSGEPIPTPKNGSGELKQIVLKACSFDPKDRYQSAREMLVDLQRLSGGTIPATVLQPVAVPEVIQAQEVQEEATVGPVFTRNEPPAAEESDKTVGPTFALQKVETAVEDKTVGQSFDRHNVVPAKEQDKPVGTQFAANARKKPVKKNKIGLIAAAVLVLVGLCVAFFALRNPKPQYTLMEDSCMTSDNWSSYYVFNSKYRREQIRSITFLKSVKDAPADSWDVSREQNGTVLAWVIPNGDLFDLYIAGEGGVKAPENCFRLFAGYCNMKELKFAGFDTSSSTNMRDMFLCCSNLRQLDLRNFDTSLVTNMRGMFYRCDNLNKINLSGMNTSSVTSMMDMFAYCYNLDKLDLSSFDTSNVTEMSWMFLKCENLRSLDVSSFDTTQVLTMCGMFEGCSSLTELDVSGFDTSNVTDMSYMFYGCSSQMKVDVSHFDISKVQYYERFMSPGRIINGRPWVELFQK